MYGAFPASWGKELIEKAKRSMLNEGEKKSYKILEIL